MSKALYRKYRSKSLGEIVGQSHVTNILARSLAEGRVAHAYLLTGPRGVGKTSIARILAHEINQLPYEDDTPHLDIIEIDAASNNGVEDVRDLREKIQIAPVSAAKKVYIIDEVHMLSKAAFNALLKTLEEPPEHAVFILATTDSDKLPATIISRTQRFHFRAISVPDAIKHLKHIAEQEKIKVSDDALELIAIRGDGSFRDSISLLDQLRSIADSKTGITRALVEEALGLAPAELVAKLLGAYQSRDLGLLIELLDESENQGIQAMSLTNQLIQTVRQEILTKPELIPLLDQLLEVAKSPRPGLKLLTILAAHASPRSKNAALIAPATEISAPIAELERQAVRPKPKMPPASSSYSQQPNLQHENLTEAVSTKPGQQRVTTSGTAVRPASAEEPEGDQKKIAIDFDWQKLIDHAREHYVAVYSVLSKCAYEVDRDRLIIYAKNAFYKRKLDDSKHRINFQKSLVAIGAGDLTIETVPTSPPPKDSQAAAIAAIMGGGEEVSVEE